MRRVHIPKGDGTKTRPIGIPTFEDKILQRAVAMALEAVYEQDFLDCSYGFRPASTTTRHRTVEELWYVLEGAGEIWRGRDGEPSRVDAIRAGSSLRIPVDTAFQFRAASDGDLKLVLAMMPLWPEAQEAVHADGGPL